MSIRGRLLAALAAGGLGAVLAVAGASAASAHDTLEQTDPASGATVKTLSAVTLTFNADPLGTDGATVVQVVGPDRKYYETACPDLNGTDVVSPAALGPSGTYEVLWRVVSSDGHPISGSYTFSYAPDGSASPAAHGSATPKCGPKAASSTAPDAAAPAEGADPGVWIGLGIGAVVLVGVGVGAWALARGRRE
ncbi:copper resistance CopC family protein [uncultured Microbacterium sp.]|uniref:copper resistance CopC family protein n=1 Tax=uncultured Microbacterium sp. TaxID=191216 RepID=UPI0025CF8D31|nr:copper resistance CopC family protein [uncultured Microbacterium sp.]